MTKNRELKFRAWDIKNKTWSKWIRENSLAPGIDLAADENFVFQQYTGLKDNEGNEIYEGDILTNNFVNPDNQIVIYENGKFTVTDITIGCNDLFDEISQSARHRIIGNIFDNPELLK